MGSAIRLTNDYSASRVLADKLASVAGLSEDDLSALRATVLRLRDVPGGLRLPMDRRTPPGVVVTGWLGRVHMLADGRRQIVNTILPGEIVGPYPNPFVTMATVSITDAKIADLSPVLDMVAQAPLRHANVRTALDLAARAEEARLVEQVVRLGRRSAMERVGHWLLDVQHRLMTAGLCSDDTFPMPLTQETLGDVLGLSLVHVNRIVQQLRRDGLVDLRGGYATILDPARLKMITEYTALAAFIPMSGEADAA